MKFEDVYREYYRMIFNYCFAKLNDYKYAEECTDDVFLAFFNKIHKLRLTENVPAWLYKAAKFQLKKYYRMKRDDVSLELSEEKETDPHIIESSIFNDIINDDEIKLLTDYYISGESINKIASDRGMTESAAYQKISRIRRKIIKNAEKLKKFLH